MDSYYTIHLYNKWCAQHNWWSIPIKKYIIDVVDIITHMICERENSIDINCDYA